MVTRRTASRTRASPPASAAIPAMTAEAARTGFLDWMQQERHAAANTVEAYGHALAGFLGFLTSHLGGEPDLAALVNLRAADIRGWLAALANDKLAASSRGQHLSALRGFFRYLTRRHGVEVIAVRLVSTARARPALPRALTVAQARDVTENIGDAADNAAIQVRDIAFFSLLYGSGLRIAEALSLNVRDATALRSNPSLTVTGKGSKTRIVPVLPAVASAIQAWLTVHPDPQPDHPLFLGARGKRLDPAVAQKEVLGGGEAGGGVTADDLGDVGEAAGGVAGTCDAARVKAFFRNPLAGQRQRSAFDPGLAGARQPVHHATLHLGR